MALRRKLETLFGASHRSGGTLSRHGERPRATRWIAVAAIAAVAALLAFAAARPPTHAAAPAPAAAPPASR